MNNDAIAGRMPSFKYETASTFDEIGGMVEELASCPPGHERANQLAQQIRSHLDRVGSQIGEMQPEPGAPAGAVVGEPVRGPAITDEGANFAGPQRTYESAVERQQALRAKYQNDLYPYGGDTYGRAAENGYEQGHREASEAAPEVVEMEKKVGGETVQITVWEASAHHLEADGWKRIAAPREVEDGDRPVGENVA